MREVAVKNGHSEQAQPRHAEPHDGAAIEGRDQRSGLAVGARRLGRSNVGVRGRFHPAEAGQKGQEGPRQERDACVQPQAPREEEKNEDRIDRQDLVLAREERHRALSDVPRDACHLGVALGRALDADIEATGEQQREGAGTCGLE